MLVPVVQHHPVDTVLTAYRATPRPLGLSQPLVEDTVEPTQPVLAAPEVPVVAEVGRAITEEAEVVRVEPHPQLPGVGVVVEPVYQAKVFQDLLDPATPVLRGVPGVLV